ncbi:MAG TPA: TonB family protein [Bacteroidales bacterium]|nr:TonB family protein [Bacteroidales bacterium]
MKELVTYALESSICLMLFWIFYAVFLRADTRHTRNRAYLLMSVVLAVLIPLLNFRLRTGSPILPPEGLAGLLLPEAHITGSGTGAGLLADPAALITLVYITGAAVSGALFLTVGLRLLWMIAVSGNQGKIIRYEDDRPVCYSAFGYIFISSSIPAPDAERMIAHERNHLSRLHHIDLCITGLVNILQWFNPAAYLLRRSLMAVHEYEADSECINLGEEVTSYQQLLVSAVLNTRLSLISNTFSKSSLLKNRIIMMTKKKNGSTASLKLIMAIPLAALMIFAFSCKQTESQKIDSSGPEPVIEKSGLVYDTSGTSTDKNVFMVVEEMPTFPGGDSALLSYVYKNIKYPEDAKSKGIEGRVILRFVVDKLGNVTDIVVVRSVDPLLDQAAYEVLKNCPQWNPGKQGGLPVDVYYSIPIQFALR